MAAEPSQVRGSDARVSRMASEWARQRRDETMESNASGYREARLVFEWPTRMHVRVVLKLQRCSKPRWLNAMERTGNIVNWTLALEANLAAPDQPDQR